MLNKLYRFLVDNKVYEYLADAIIMKYTSEIQRASLSDLDRLFDIERQCFHPHQVYSRRHLNQLISKINSVTLVEKYEDIIRGFVIVLLHNKFQMAGIETIDVDPKYRGQGIALNLLHAAENQVKDRGLKLIQLEVSTTNDSAIKLYSKAGFYKSVILNNYYFNYYNGSRDAYRMIKHLNI